jgi:hypothetical protein
LQPTSAYTSDVVDFLDFDEEPSVVAQQPLVAPGVAQQPLVAPVVAHQPLVPPVVAQLPLVAPVVVYVPAVVKPLPSALQLQLRGSHPSHRSPLQNIALCEHMRFCRSQGIVHREREQNKCDRDTHRQLLESSAFRLNALVRHCPKTLALQVTGLTKTAKLSAHAWLRLAFDYTTAPISILSQVFQCARKTVNIAMKLVAIICLNIQLVFLQQLARFAQSTQSLVVAVYAIQFDETKKNMLIPQPKHADLTKRQRRVALHVMVSLSKLACVWELRGNIARQRFEICRPVVFLTSTAAHCLAEALTTAPPIRDLWLAVVAILRAVRFGVLHWGRDGAASNDKCIASLMEQFGLEHPRLLQSDKVCSMHSNHLVTTSLIGQSMEVVSKLYVFASLCKAGTTFLKAIRVLPLVAAEQLRMCRGPPPPGCQAFASQLLQFACLYHVSHHSSTSHVESIAETLRKEETSRDKFRQHGLSLLAVLNGQLWRTDGWYHYCESESCCQGYSKHACMLKLLKSMTKFVLHISPSSPEVGKWTKLAPALDTVLVAACFHQCYRSLFRRALSRESFAKCIGRAQEAGTFDEHDVDAMLMNDIAFEKVQGKRAKSTLDYLDDKTLVLKTVGLALASEPVRAMMISLFSCSKSSSPLDCVPPIAVFANPDDSPMLQLLQYCSSFCSSRSVDRLVLLSCMAGFTSIDAFTCSDPLHPMIEWVGDLMLTCASWLHRRHWLSVVAWPWKLSVLIDPHAKSSTIQSVSMSFDRSPACCLDMFFGLKLRSLLDSDGASLEDASVLACIRTWATEVDMTTAQTEFRHARHKRQNPSKDISSSSFVARTFNTEVLARFKNEKRESQVALQHLESDSSATPKKRKAPAKGMSDLQMYHKHVVRREKLLGRSFNCASSEFWAEVKAEFAALAPDDPVREHCRIEAAETSAAARHAKMQCKMSAIQDVAVNPDMPSEAHLEVVESHTLEVGSLPVVSLVMHASPPESVFAVANDLDMFKAVVAADRPLHSSMCNMDNLNGMKVKVAAESWAQRTAHPVTGMIDFPSHVTYHRPCTSLCKTATRQHVLQVHQVMLERLKTAICSMQNKSLRPMIEVCVSSSDVVACKHYFHLASWMPQAGVFKFRGNFIQCKSVDAKNQSSIITSHTKPEVIRVCVCVSVCVRCMHVPAHPLFAIAGVSCISRSCAHLGIIGGQHMYVVCPLCVTCVSYVPGLLSLRWLVKHYNLIESHSSRSVTGPTIIGSRCFSRSPSALATWAVSST